MENQSRRVYGGFVIEKGEAVPFRAEATDGVADGLSLWEEAPDADFRGIFVKDVLNCHTHCGDYGLEVPPGLSLEELVAPPDGLKHRHLASLSRGRLESDMRRFAADSAATGSVSFVDFREGGAEGCRALRSASPGAVILGRPVSPEYDRDEIAEILEVADGIGIPSVSDMPRRYIEQVADDVREARKVFAIHVSERVREDIDFVLTLDPAFVVHMCEATDDDLCKCAEAEVPVVACPRSNAYFGKEPPLVRMDEQGVDVALGTDNGMLCRPDMGVEASAAMAVLARQGGSPSDAFGMLSRLTKKIFNKKALGENDVGFGTYMGIPLDGGPSVSFRVSRKKLE